MREFCARLERIGVIVVLALCLLIIAVLLPSSLTESWYKIPTQHCYAHIQDNAAVNLAVLALYLILAYIMLRLCHRLDLRALSAIVCSMMAIFSFFVIFSVRMYPGTDADYLTQTALKLTDGSFSAGGAYVRSYITYLSAYPFQLGYVQYERMIFSLLRAFYPAIRDTWMVMALQGANVVWMVLGVASVIFAVKEIFQSEKTAKLTAVLLLFAVQMIPYTSFLYGIIPAFALSACAVWQFALFNNRGLIRNALMCALAMLLAVWMKYNSIITFVALMIVWFFTLLNRPSKKLALCMLITALLVIGLKGLPIKAVSKEVGVDFDRGVTMMNWVSIGLDSNRFGNPGVLDPEERIMSYLAGEMSEEQFDMECRDSIRESIDIFSNDAGYTAAFFYEKTGLLWNNPDYDSVWTCLYDGGHYSGTGVLYQRLLSGSLPVYEYMNFYQQFVFFGFLLGLLALLKSKKLVSAFYPLIILGGSLYHLICEAKSQYMFQYFIFMLPVAAYGLMYLYDLLESRAAKIKCKTETVTGG